MQHELKRNVAPTLQINIVVSSVYVSVSCQCLYRDKCLRVTIVSSVGVVSGVRVSIISSVGIVSGVYVSDSFISEELSKQIPTNTMDQRLYIKNKNTYATNF
jgi:predicted transporter